MQLGKGKREFNRIAKQMNTQKARREINEMKRLIPDQHNDPLLDVGESLALK